MKDYATLPPADRLARSLVAWFVLLPALVAASILAAAVALGLVSFVDGGRDQRLVAPAELAVFQQGFDRHA